MEHPDSDFYRWMHNFKRSEYFLGIMSYHEKFLRNELCKTLEPQTHYWGKILEALKKYDTIPPVEDDWYSVARFGYSFFRYSELKKELDGLYVWCILVEHIEIMLGDDSMFSPLVNVEEIRMFLLAYIKGYDYHCNFNARDTIVLTYCLIMALIQSKSEFFYQENSVAIRNLEALIFRCYKQRNAFEPLHVDFIDKMQKNGPTQDF